MSFKTITACVHFNSPTNPNESRRTYLLELVPLDLVVARLVNSLEDLGEERFARLGVRFEAWSGG